MLIIEIHGVEEERAKRIRTKIEVVLKEMPYAENYRIAICREDAIGDWNSRLRVHSWDPFFRVFFDPDEKSKGLILRALWPFLIDIQWLDAGGYILNDRRANPDNYREVATESNYEDT